MDWAPHNRYSTYVSTASCIKLRGWDGDLYTLHSNEILVMTTFTLSYLAGIWMLLEFSLYKPNTAAYILQQAFP